MIEIKNVYTSFGKKRVLNNLSIKIEKGEIYGLLGANGAENSMKQIKVRNKDA